MRYLLGSSFGRLSSGQLNLVGFRVWRHNATDLAQLLWPIRCFSKRWTRHAGVSYCEERYQFLLQHRILKRPPPVVLDFESESSKADTKHTSHGNVPRKLRGWILNHSWHVCVLVLDESTCGWSSRRIHVVLEDAAVDHSYADAFDSYARECM